MAILRLNNMDYIYYFLLAVIFMKIAYIDYKEHAIYDRDNLLAALLVALYSIYNGIFLDALLGAAIGFAIGFAIFFVAYKFYGFEAFGLGDVFLLGILGLLFAQDFLSYFSISLMVSGFLILLLVPFVGYRRICSLEIPLAPLLLVWIPIFWFFGKPSIITIIQKIL